MNAKYLLVTFLVISPFFFMSCNNSSENKEPQNSVSGSKDTVMDHSAQLAESEKKKAEIEAAASGYTRIEIDLAKSTASASVKQSWAKMDVYSDASGIRKIRLYPHPGNSQRTEEYYFEKGKMFFTFISDSGLTTENRDEGTPGKEFHFMNEKLIKYDDRSGDKESNPAEEKKMYELKLPLEAEELYALAVGK